MNKLLSSIALVLSLWITLSLCVIMTDHKASPIMINDCVEDGVSESISENSSQNITIPEIPTLDATTPVDQKKEEAPQKKSAGEFTFGIIKPNAVQAGFTGDIIRLIELNGFTIEKMEKKQLTKKEVEEFYKEHKDRPFFKDLVHFMISGPVIILKLKKPNAVVAWRKLMGATNPERARVGTLRAMFGEDITHNAVHGSDSDANAGRELAFFNLI